jgi:hypothetical protein
MYYILLILLLLGFCGELTNYVHSTFALTLFGVTLKLAELLCL